MRLGSLQMLFEFFALGVTAVFFVTSLGLLNYGRRLGLRYLQQQGLSDMPGLSQSRARYSH